MSRGSTKFDYRNDEDSSGPWQVTRLYYLTNTSASPWWPWAALPSSAAPLIPPQKRVRCP
jgi:hypothetical protein